MEHYIYQGIVICHPFASAAGVIACYFSINFKMMAKKVPAVGVQQIHNIPVLLYSFSITAVCMGFTFPYTFYAIMQPVTILQMSIPGFVVYLFYLQIVLDPIFYFSF